jgi:ubiquinone/menaquinone biosynthesis C-methylase UbiE
MTNPLYNATYFRRSKKFQSGSSRLDEFVGIVKSYSPKRVLDIGCGIGFLVRRLRDAGIDAWGTDFAKDLQTVYWKDAPYFQLADAIHQPFMDKEFDLVISTDFFEHVPEQDIDDIVKEMQRVGNKVITRLAYKAELYNRQVLYHVTNKSKDWWEGKLNGKVDII